MKSNRGVLHFLNFFLLQPLLFFSAAQAGFLPDGSDPENFQFLHYRFIGPAGNRVSAVTGVPGQPNVFFIGAASGGVFKTTDGGAHWHPVFDDQSAASIGSLAVAPSDSNIVWAGTGETFIRSNVSVGNGVYKSTDGGESWTRMGLENSGRIGRIVIDPVNPDVVLVAALGHLYGPQQQRGVFKTGDGGKTWKRVLFVDEDTGASDLVMDPNNPRILLAGMWQMLIRPWGRWSGGPGSGLYRSTDQGETWHKLEGNGLPRPPLGKIGLTMSADDSQRIYALIETNSNRDFASLEEHQGVLWRSDDGGRKWRLINSGHRLVQRPLYYSRAVAAPDDADEIYFLATEFNVSKDGGRTFRRDRPGGDHHDMWIDPKLPDRMIVGHDQGISISTNRGKSWFRPLLPIAQIYHVYTDNRVPYFVYGNRQDGPSFRGPSNSLTPGEIPIGAWHSVGGCESGFAIPDPVDNQIVWSGCYDGILDRHNLQSGHSRNVSVWPDAIESWPAGEVKYRFQWTFPIAISPHDHNRVYAGSQYVHETSDAGASWRVISPDLTGNDPEKQQKTGGLTPDDAGPTIFPVVFAISESPLNNGEIWAGTNDGRVQLTRDGGQSWTDLTAALPDLPPLGTVSNIEPSRHQSGSCYLSVDRHQLDDPQPYVFKTNDFGKSWRAISSGLPRSVHGYVHVIREDPVRQGLLYAGTENGIFVSFDDGENWTALQGNLPHAPVYWLTIQETFNDLVVATYGRGFWILDDVTPLQQIREELFDSEAHLFAPRSAYRFRYREAPMSQPGDPAAGENPEYGASIHYYLKSETSDRLELSILDAQGRVVRRLGKSDEDHSREVEEADLFRTPGIHRLHWDLRYQQAKKPRLRMAPVEHSHVEIPKRGWREQVEASAWAPLVAPGTYTVQLKLADRQWTETLEVLKDPNSEGTVEEIGQQTDVLLDLYRMTNEVVDFINELEWIRKQLDDLKPRLPESAPNNTLLENLQELKGKVVELEEIFIDLRLTNAGQDTLRWPRRLYSKITSLAAWIGQSDFAPTQQQMEVYELHRRSLSAVRTRISNLREQEIRRFNALLRENDIPHVQTGLR